MSRQLGYFDDSERDFPDLNKCPDCETFFEGDNCPLCGKLCPEEMRAGNRAPLKKSKHRSSGNGRVQFIPWYFSTWAILIAFLINPLIGVILMWNGYWKRSVKITFTVIGLVALVLLYVILPIYSSLFWEHPVADVELRTDLSREEYIEHCSARDSETVYRKADELYGEFVTMTLSVKGDIVYQDGWNYYLCTTEDENGRVWEFWICDCREEDGYNLASGDLITVYGQIAGNITVYADTGLTRPCVSALYIET